MLQLVLSFTQEKWSATSKRIRWPDLRLGWISTDDQLFGWEKLPFCPANWRTMALTSKENKLAVSSIHDDQNLESKEICEEDHLLLIEGSTPRHSCAIVPAGSNSPGLDVNGEAEDVDTEAEGLLQHVVLRANVKMDARIWSALPEDITEKVLARLPLTSVLRFRTVCRLWRSVLLSGSFLSSHSRSSLHRPHPCFLLCTIGQFACTFDPSIGKWLTLCKPTFPGASVIASTGSLFCLGNQVTECRVLSMWNPITHSLRQLPAMRRLQLIHKITMFEDHGRNVYTIVVTGEQGLPTPNPQNFSLITEVYKSGSDEWQAADDPPPEATFGSDQGVWCEGAFYCLTELPYGIVKFSAEVRIWEEVRVPMPVCLAFPSLVVVRSRLLMVGRCGQGRATGIRIWELTQGKKETSKPMADHDDDVGVIRKGAQAAAASTDQYEWVEVVEVPSSLSVEFLAPLGSTYSPFVCAGVGSSVYITTHLSPKVLVLDLTMPSTEAQRWRWLPQDPLFPKQRDFHLLGFSFEPRFDASP